ncbi:SGNH/GDSL hydrolase family protein [Streptomyces sp. NWU49]|uniref:Secreted hydrolase n=1 Tax=Streptomyces viridosporus (strain ATCC 14672 / DSM 40746 / JCM 4963 / KCTC 9882 / NRRL B-12104 / FH 1290) TaxID=566461 RepID=D5ZVL0_STRV1|nr:MULTISPECIES: SGNH/GDSL hydrolase family protein [Streptomyces]EFE65005.1 secreted hydrolase [Streptomyces viridosporus ATCC 14672]PWJ02605.1 SGNH/GDSL hydrolase family protein [Streptomyces sp. NWU49]
MSKHALRNVMSTSFALVGALALSFTDGTAHASTSLDYVALGDSYSAGSGVLPVDPTNLLCLRSTVNYPHVITARTGARLKDVTCGAAQTKDFTESQYPGVAPQTNALGTDTDLVTLTIGGNDNGTFINAMTACGTAGVLSGGKGSPCKDKYGTSFTDQIDANTYPALKSALRTVRAKAPNARVAVLGYPWIMPAEADPSCFVKLPVAAGDVSYVRGIQARLNAAVERASEETGATYVDFSRVSEGHDACKPGGTRWIEPLLFGNSLVPVHPNALGQQRMAEHTMGVLGLN